MKTAYDIDFILSCLPQTPPFVYIDRIVEHLPGERMRAIKNVTISEPYFQGHFPGRKIMPGVLVCECLAQACALFAILERRLAGGDTQQAAPAPGLLSAVKVKFVQPVCPGDQLILEVKKSKGFQGIASYEVNATVAGAVVATGTLQASSQ